MANYRNSLADPYVPEVAVPNLAAIDRAVYANALQGQQVQDAFYKRGVHNAINDVYLQDPNASGDTVKNSLAGRGFGKEGEEYGAKMNINALNRASVAKAETDFISRFAPMVKDQASLDQVRAKYQQVFGVDIPPQFHQYYDGLGNDALRMSLGAGEQVKMQRQDATGKALGIPAGVDPSTYIQGRSTQQQMDQSAGLYPGKVKAQGLENTGKDLANQGKQAELDAVDEGYALPGNRFLTTRDALKVYHEAKRDNSDPEFTFERFVSGFNSATKNKKTGAITVDAPATPQTPQAPQVGQGAALPDHAKAKLKEGVPTRFNNGQVWTLKNGQPVQVQ